MSAVRKTRTGKWEVDVRSRLLPRRRSFQFDSEAEARAWSEQCDRLLDAGVVPPELLQKSKLASKGPLLGPVLREYVNRGQHSASDGEVLERLFSELCHIKLDQITFAWCERWIGDLKMVSNLAPGTIRKRVGALSRALDWHLRSNPGTAAANPLHLLPRGYSTYSKSDAKAVGALGGHAKTDISRDRRLLPGEEDRIRRALAGERREDRERPLALPEGPALSILFDIIVGTGARLREAYMLRLEDVDLERKTLRMRSSKQWHGKIAYRTVPIRREVYAVLEPWVRHRQAAPDNHAALLFPFWDGDQSENSLRLTSGRLSQRFKGLFGYAGCDDLTEHDLRHEATCRWFEMRDASGGWLYRTEEVRALMGWKPGSRMVDRYASFRAEDLAYRLWRVEDAAAPAQAASGIPGKGGSTGAARRRKRAPDTVG